MSYRDTWRLFLRFIAERKCRSVSDFAIEDLTANEVLAFLRYSEEERKVTIGTRNCRLAALRSFFRFVAKEVREMAEGPGPEGGRFYIHGEEWFDKAGDYLQYKLFMLRTDRRFVLRANTAGSSAPLPTGNFDRCAMMTATRLPGRNSEMATGAPVRGSSVPIISGKVATRRPSRSAVMYSL